MALKDHGFRTINIYTYITLLIFISLGSVCINTSNSIDNLTARISVTAKQITWDWSQVPFTDMKLVDTGSGCGEGWEPMIARYWGGLGAACDCLNTLTSSEYYGQFLTDQVCSDNMIAAGCVYVNGSPGTWMNNL